WREVLALDVLEQAVESGRLVAELDDVRRNRAPLARRALFAKELERAAAAVTGDDLETRPYTPNDDAMDKPALENRLGQLLNVVGIDVLSGLVGIVVEQLERDAHLLPISGRPFGDLARIHAHVLSLARGYLVASMNCAYFGL